MWMFRCFEDDPEARAKRLRSLELDNKIKGLQKERNKVPSIAVLGS